VTVATGAFVARRNGKVFVTGNSGFPKSHDVSKAIDKAAGAEREVVGFDAAKAAQQTAKSGTRSYDDFAGSVGDITAHATEAAKQWQGWGTALKPAWEPIIVARKPLIGTVAANALAHGTGGLNIDACRVEATSRPKIERNNQYRPENFNLPSGSKLAGETSLGRWPANLILSYPVDEYQLRDDVTPAQLEQLAGWLRANA